MPTPTEILSPRPLRPLKRRRSELELAHILPTKRLKTSARVEYWLNGVVDRIECRSDSFLLRSPTYRRNNTRSDSFLGHQTMSGRGPAFGEVDPAVPSSSFQESSDPRGTRDRVARTGYRDNLSHHGIHIDQMGYQIPAHVKQFAEDVVFKMRSSPPLTSAQVEEARRGISDLIDRSEGPICRELMATHLFPQPNRYRGQLHTGGNTQFSTLPLPHNPKFNIPPVVTPKPDVHYGYSKNLFTRDEQSALSHSRLSSFTKPTGDNILPFLIFEIKSFHGSRWVAENRAAGAGAHSVNSMKTLLTFAAHDNSTRKISTTDSLCFSFVTDTEGSSLWVHFANDQSDFVSTRLQGYWMSEPKDIQRFCSDVKNILDYMLDVRLVKVKEAIRDLLPTLEPPQATAALKRRRSTTIVSSSQRPPTFSEDPRSVTTIPSEASKLSATHRKLPS